MRYLKSYKVFESFEEEIVETFSSIISNAKTVTIPYKPDINFNVYVLYGDRIESDEHTLLKELYDYREICKNIFNKDYFSVILREDVVIIVLKDYQMDDGFKYYLKNLRMSMIASKVPVDIMRSLNLEARRSAGGGTELGEGIRYTNGDSGNLALYDWQYQSK